MDAVPAMTDLAGTIGPRLRQVRGSLSQADFGDKIGVNKDLIGKYERGESVPGGEILLRYREKAGADINWLLTGIAVEAKTTLCGEPDEELGLMIAASVSAAYENVGRDLPVGRLGKQIVAIYHQAMMLPTEEERLSYAATVSVKLLRELQKSADEEAEAKRRA